MNRGYQKFTYTVSFLCFLYALVACSGLSTKGEAKKWEAFLAYKPDTVFIPLTAPKDRTSVLDTLAYGIWDRSVFVKERNRWVEYIPEAYSLDIARCLQVEYRDSIAGDTTYLFRADGKRYHYYYLVNDTQLYSVEANEAPRLLKKYRYLAQIEMEYWNQQREQEMLYNTLGWWKAYLYMPEYKELKEREYRLYWKDTVLHMRAGIKDIAVKPEVVADGLKLNRLVPLNGEDALDAVYWLVSNDKEVLKEYHSAAMREKAEKDYTDWKGETTEATRELVGNSKLIDYETRKQDMKKPYVEVVWE